MVFSDSCDLLMLQNQFSRCSNMKFVPRKSMSDYDPRLIAPTCLYLASKVEESTVQARLLVFYIKKMCGMSYNHVYCHIYMEKLQ